MNADFARETHSRSFPDPVVTTVPDPDPIRSPAPAARSARSVRGTVEDPYDVIGVGFGPSNIALAVAADELDPGAAWLFVEQGDRVRWHPGMLIDGARMQISYLKDLVSLRDLASPYTFLQYAKASGRLERFVNLDDSRPTRIEYQDYLRWVGAAFADRVRFGTRVTAVRPVRRPGEGTCGLFAVHTEDLATGAVGVHHAADVVYAAGGRPRSLPGGVPDTRRVLHSSAFLPELPERFPEHDAAYEFGVVGDGQSAGEIVAYLMEHYPRARVHMFVPGYAPRATDNSPFGNEQYYERNAELTRSRGRAYAAAMRTGLRTTNYGVVEESVLDQLYRRDYADEVQGVRRLVLHPFSRVESASGSDADGVTVVVRDGLDGSTAGVRCDGVVLATGYDRSPASTALGDLLPLLRLDDHGDLQVGAEHRVRTTDELTAGLYVQGFAEASFGLGDTLLSLLPFRSRDIVTDVRGRRDDRELCEAPRARARAAYPPPAYVEQDRERLFALMEDNRFATVVSARTGGEVLVTHVPLTLDRLRGGHGVLFGHVDRANPHARLLDGGTVTVVFHGPNAYMSPDLFDVDPLPTWNSMNVHVRGTVGVVRERRRLLDGLRGICEHAEPGPGAYRLDVEDPRIDRIIDGVVGFEITIEEIVGRFKISQELDEGNRCRAASELADAHRRRQRVPISSQR